MEVCAYILLFLFLFFLIFLLQMFEWILNMCLHLNCVSTKRKKKCLHAMKQFSNDQKPMTKHYCDSMQFSICTIYKYLFQFYVFFILKFRLEKYKKRKQIQSTVQPLKYYGSHQSIKKEMVLLITTSYLIKIEAKMK